MSEVLILVWYRFRPREFRRISRSRHSGIARVVAKNLTTPLNFCEHLIADDFAAITAALCDLTDAQKCPLVFTTGGTGPAVRDITPQATLAIAEREMPGFGEEMRRVSLRYVPTAILSRQTAVVRGGALIINLPGQPKR